ncbi:MAG: N-acetylmuramoyl-L-alanine amidase [Planctomycetota bacterium]|nr:N-acetylmuramoyl-L-alanine amidase [Planctomycetota bacterium]
MFFVSNKLRLVVFVVSAATVLAGCNNAGSLQLKPDELISAPLGAISIFQLAGRLGLEVADSDQTAATLRDTANVVVVYGDPDGQAYVNGQPVGSLGGIAQVGGVLFVPERLEADIRLALRVPQPRPARPPAPAKPLAWHVALDPGHGGRDSGAISVGGYYEKTVNLAVCRMVRRELLSRGVEVTMTRMDDTFVELNERAAIANIAEVDLFVSIHADSARNRTARGFTVYVARSASRPSLAAAECVRGRLGTIGAPDRGVRQANFRVLVRTSCPAVLVEMGYLSNIREAARLARSGYQNRLAQAIADGVCDFLQEQTR